MGHLDFFDNWTTQVRKGILEVCVLNILQRNSCYGYDLIRIMVAIPGLGVTEGTMYPLLSRLKQQGIIQSTVADGPSGGPPRKYYSLTDKGKKLATLTNAHLDKLYAGAKNLLEESEDGVD